MILTWLTSHAKTNNKGFAAVRGRLTNVDMNMFTGVVPEPGKKEEELQVMKRGLSVFAGSDLEMILKSLGVQHLILQGMRMC
jgi:nicotinamidase-related amidase